MCEFCVKHGEGKKWYLAMKNYSRELWEQNGRLEFTAEFTNTFERRMPGKLSRLAAVSATPLRGIARRLATWHYKRIHFGQVVPIEEIEQILRQVDGIARLSCVCRRLTTGRKDVRYCYALTADPRLADMLDGSFNLEYLTAEKAIDAIRKLDDEGLIHTIWTFKTPFIGAICNCDRDCVAYRICHARKYFPLMFHGEFVAQVDREKCNGCRNCLRQCQFGAIRYSSSGSNVEVDRQLCYGCGVCRATCARDAITLSARPAVIESPVL